MDAKQTITEKVTVSELLGLATWDRPRTTEELRAFITQRETAIAGK